MRSVELLSPAKNLECGKEAILHGADAVYIGAPSFGARAAAGNSLEDIKELCDFAHPYGVRIYVALNTILKDEELPQAEQMAWDLYRAGVDALIVQDMGLTQLNLPPIPLHASTQMDNRTAEKVRFLAEAGFSQVVLARELSLTEIANIHKNCPDVSLEVFVHGALCVSYSGRCYASEACYGRSANRGECAQFCRLPFDLLDAEGKVVTKGRHLLSLKDLCQLDILESLLDAGAVSLKIEGRLKDISYVKNITAAYRQVLDKIIRRRPQDFRRASYGQSMIQFDPVPQKSFNRGFTHYFAEGRVEGIYQPASPKSMGEEMGVVKDQRQGYISVAGVKSFHNGDGACYIDRQGRLQGFRVNRVEGNRLFPASQLERIEPHTPLYRNYDQEFERQLAHPTAVRTLAVRWTLQETAAGYSLEIEDECGLRAARQFDAEKTDARTPQTNNIRTQFSKLGGTIFTLSKGPAEEVIRIRLNGERFLPSSLLADWRRQLLDALLRVHRVTYPRQLSRMKVTHHPYVTNSLDFTGNVYNEKSRTFYQQHGVLHIQPAFEQQHAIGVAIMQTRHCLRFAMGWCPKHGGQASPFREPYTLRTSDGKTFPLRFDCKNCRMEVLNN